MTSRRLVEMTIRGLRVGVAGLLLLTACVSTTGDTTNPPEVETSTTDPASTVPTSVATSSTSTTAAPTTTVPESFTWPAEGGPDRYAIMYEELVQFAGLEGTRVLDIPNVRAGVVFGDELLFAVNGVSGTWIWPPQLGSDMNVLGGAEPVRLLIGQTGTETGTWFHDAAVIDGRQLVLYRAIESETDPIQERMMLYGIQDGQAVELFDKFERRDGLFQEELGAPIGDAALASDRIAVLFAFGDSTWIEWYDLRGNPVDRPPSLEALEGTVLEIAIADDKVAVGVETDLHRLITHLWILDLATGELSGPMIRDVAGQSLRNLAFDGRWLTATIAGPEGEPIGSYFADTTSQSAEITRIPVAIAPARG